MNNKRKEFLMFKYDVLIFLRHSGLVTLSVLGEIVRLMPTEKITPATVYSVLFMEASEEMHLVAGIDPGYFCVKKDAYDDIRRNPVDREPLL